MQHKHTQTNEAEDAVAVAEAASEAAIDAARPARDIKVLMLGKLSALRLNRDRLISERNRRKFDGHDTDAVDADLAGVRGEIRRFKLHQPPQFKRYLMGIDCAATSNDGSDFSAAVVVGVTENAWYVVDVVRRKIEFPELQKLGMQMYEKWHPRKVYIEKASNGHPLLHAWQRDTKLPCVGITAKGSKAERLELKSPLFEAGRIYLPEEADWLLDFERELLASPFWKRSPDMIDAFLLAINDGVDRKKFVYAKVIEMGPELVSYGPRTSAGNIMRNLRTGIF